MKLRFIFKNYKKQFYTKISNKSTENNFKNFKFKILKSLIK